MSLHSKGDFFLSGHTTFAQFPWVQNWLHGPESLQEDTFADPYSDIILEVGKVRMYA